MAIGYGKIPRIATNIYMGSMTTLDALKTKVDLEVARCRKAGISRVVPNPRVAYSAEKGFYFGSGSFEYSINEILDYIETRHTDIVADAIKISTIAIEELFTTDTIRQQYVSFITDVASQLASYELEFFTIANEAYAIYGTVENEQMMLDCIAAVQAQGIPCGITTEGMLDVAKTREAILRACDVIAVNVYPLISFKGEYTTYQDCVEGWQTLGFAEWVKSMSVEYGKKIMISETGIRDYMEFYTQYYDMDDVITTELAPTGSKAMAMWLYGLCELVKDDKVPLWRIQLWYLDSIASASDFFELKGVMDKYEEVKE